MGETVENEHIAITVNVDELRQRLSPDKFLVAVDKVLASVAKEIEIAAAPYPEEGPWNQPGPYPARWYQRHFGSRWALKSGGVGGRNTSEQMQKRWKTGRAGKLAWHVGNVASYAPYVMGEEQQPYHAAHGWRKLSDIARDVIKDMADDIVRQVADKWLQEQ